MAQGFVKSNNLVESNTGGLDRAILDNLGGPNISNDILLFDGNSQFISKLIATDYTVVNGIVTVNGTTKEGRVAFSNGTRLSHDGGNYIYIVKNSNGVDKFQVYTFEGNVLFSPTGVLRRSDVVTGINLANLSRKRLVTDVGTSTGIGTGQGSQDLFNRSTVNGQVSFINGQIGLFYFKRTRVPLTYENTSFKLPVRFDGSFRITNDLVGNQSVAGLFIVDTNNPAANPVRAFGDTTNPWSTNSGAIVTTETTALCSVLKLKPSTSTVNINFDGTAVAGLIVTETNTVASYTHKLPVVVNGQQYFLLLKA